MVRGSGGCAFPGQNDALDRRFARDDPAFPCRVRANRKNRAGWIRTERGKSLARRAERFRFVAQCGRTGLLREICGVAGIEFNPRLEGRAVRRRRAVIAEVEQPDGARIGLSVKTIVNQTGRAQFFQKTARPDERRHREERGNDNARDDGASAPAGVAADGIDAEKRPRGGKASDRAPLAEGNPTSGLLEVLPHPLGGYFGMHVKEGFFAQDDGEDDSREK